MESMSKIIRQIKSHRKDQSAVGSGQPAAVSVSMGLKSGGSSAVYAVVFALFALLSLGMTGCGHSRRSQWGEPADASNAVPLSQALQKYDSLSSQTVTVSGRITEVCKAAGCWFVLQDSSSGHDDQIYVDLTHGATFTVPPDVQGKRAVVKGRIVGRKPDLKFYADGLVIS
jgi:hypothetical protein